MTTGTTCVMRPGDENVTVKSPEFSGSVSLQGVRHTWPVEVRASAPGGSDASERSAVLGPNPGRSPMDQDAHPATARPAATMTTIRFMIPAQYRAAAVSRYPRRNHTSGGPMVQPMRCISFDLASFGFPAKTAGPPQFRYALRKPPQCLPKTRIGESISDIMMTTPFPMSRG
jgi:hypothetical protein